MVLAASSIDGAMDSSKRVQEKAKEVSEALERRRHPIEIEIHDEDSLVESIDNVIQEHKRAKRDSEKP